jgi:hypothetical protein
MGFFDSLLGNTSADASNTAAADTYAKQQAAIQGINTAGANYNTSVQGLTGAYNPYIAAGGSSLTQLLNGLGLNGASGSQAFTDAYHATPGYQSGLDTGLQAAERGINASGMSQSGGALKALQRYGSNYEDQQSGNYLSRLMGLQGEGLQATGAQTGLSAQGLGGQLGAQQSAFQGGMNAAPTIGQGMVAGAQAQQQGITNLLAIGANLAGKIGGAAVGVPTFNFGGANPQSTTSGTGWF